ncbi:PREDICTED: tigger transposable element-derived protein 2 [Nicrophorus vespilloides]|uniref:Tigger transposable element-derived protein 2 n=1 Tax=Nicrophorus vespilloides TaxID=110193 RepID=A0ABM1MFF8_NICVS|nr:PREDICTED: tigger transposable element-derived protein 2 [Nicrophorus vespilloides]
MTEKRKKIVLTIKQKLELIRKFESGESTTKLANEYCIGTQTVRDINKNKAKLLEFSNNCRSKLGPSKRKSMKKSSYKELDNALINWLNDNRSAGVHVSGQMCEKQAKIFHASLGLESEFSTAAVHGWFIRFKQRYGIKDNSKGQANSVTEAIDNVLSHIKEEKEDDEYGEECPLMKKTSTARDESNSQLFVENGIIYIKQEENEPLSTAQKSRNDRIFSLPNRTNDLPQLYTAENVGNNLTQTSRDVSNAQDEFDLFGKSVAMQLRQLPLRHALICQEKLHNIIVQYRLSFMQSNSSD